MKKFELLIVGTKRDVRMTFWNHPTLVSTAEVFDDESGAEIGTAVMSAGGVQFQTRQLYDDVNKLIATQFL